MIKHTPFTVDIFETTYEPFNQEVTVDFCKMVAKSKPGRTLSNNNGYQSNDDLHYYKQMRKFFTWLTKSSKEAFNSYGFSPKAVEIQSSWFNINNGLNSHNQVHIHDGIVSGVFFVSAPEGSGKLRLINNGMNQLWPGHLNAEQDTTNNSYSIFINPVPGKCYFWPSYLMHSVDCNTKDVERISISFNLSLPT